MTASETSLEMMAKASRALRSAHALLVIDDAEGACNRAYYAMFDAAKAALLISIPDLHQDGLGKTHNGLITLFSLNLVKNGPIPKEIGKLLKRAEEIRLVADYTGDEIEPETAQEIVAQAGDFLKAIQDNFFPEP